MKNRTAFAKAAKDEHRSSTVCAVVEQPDLHCGDHIIDKIMTMTGGNFMTRDNCEETAKASSVQSSLPKNSTHVMHCTNGLKYIGIKVRISSVI